LFLSSYTVGYCSGAGRARRVLLRSTRHCAPSAHNAPLPLCGSGGAPALRRRRSIRADSSLHGHCRPHKR